MKKTIKIIAILAMIMLFVTGCGMRSNVGLEIAKDKTVTVKIVQAMDDEMIDYYLSMANNDEEGTTYTDAQRWEYVETSTDDSEYEGYAKEKYDKDGYKGYVFSKELGKIEDLIVESDEPISIDKISSDSKIFTKKGDTYTLKIDFDSDDVEQAESYKEYGVVFDLSFYITLPNKATDNNATSVSDDGKTYTWDLLQAKDANISFKLGGGLLGGSSSNVLPIVLGCVAGVAVVAVIVVVVVKVSKKGKNGNGEA